jgi:hypothetical protein
MKIIKRVCDYGDVDFDQVSEKASLLRQFRWSRAYDNCDVVENTLLAREMKRNK